MRVRGYRDSDRVLLSGPWAAGELLGLPSADRPTLDEDVVIDEPLDHRTEVCVVDGAAVVRFSELDWVNRRARLEIGMRPEAAAQATDVVRAAQAHAYGVLNLHRLYGWVTPAYGRSPEALDDAGFCREAVMPAAFWLSGDPVAREMWGHVHEHD